MFVAVNYISCMAEYKERFEYLFGSRAKAIDRMPGFDAMKVLKPIDGIGDYLIISYWDSEEHFRDWTNSPEFFEGHKRGFTDLSEAKLAGKEPPMKSIFKTYHVISE